jgi:hypothetical protein
MQAVDRDSCDQPCAICDPMNPAVGNASSLRQPLAHGARWLLQYLGLHPTVRTVLEQVAAELERDKLRTDQPFRKRYEQIKPGLRWLLEVEVLLDGVERHAA